MTGEKQDLGNQVSKDILNLVRPGSSINAEHSLEKAFTGAPEDLCYYYLLNAFGESIFQNFYLFCFNCLCYILK